MRRTCRMTSARCLFVMAVILAATVCEAEVRWIGGTNGPPTWTIAPTYPTSGTVIHFSGPTGVHSNECFAMVAGGGSPAIVIDPLIHTIELRFEPPAPEICITVWDPVCGLEGEFGPLDPGDWVFFSNSPITFFSIPFQATSGPATLRVIALDPAPGTVLADPPDSIVVTFSEDVATTSLNASSFRLVRSGGDGGFGDSNEVEIASLSITRTSLTVAACDLTGFSLPDDVYQLTLVGDTGSLVDLDAELLAMEISGELLPPPALYEQIHNDLLSIRRAYPLMSSIHHLPRWAPGEILVGLTPEAWVEFKNGNYHGLDSLNAEYGPVEIVKVLNSIRVLHLRFEQRYNPEVLAPLYAAADGVRYAEPNVVLGDGDGILASPPEYTFSKAWGDCPAGCGAHHYWVFSVLDGTAILLDEYGDPLDIPLQTSIITNLAGKALDGEFHGVFPSGDGAVGGDFVSTFTIGRKTAVRNWILY